MTEKNNSFEKHLKPWLHWRHKRFWALFILLTYTLVGFFGVPWFVERQAVNEMAKLGRTLTAEEVRANPFLLTIQVLGMELKDDDGTIILSYDDYFWDFQASSLFHWAWTFKEIRIEGLYINEERFDDLDTRYNRLISAFTSESEGQGDPKGNEEANTLPRIIIQHFQLIDGQIHFVDHMAGEFEGEFGPINIEINDLRTLPDHAGQTVIRIATSEGGHIDWQGEVGFQPLTSTGHFNIGGRGMADAFRYGNHFLPFTVAADEVEIDFDYRFALTEDGPELSLEQLVAEVHNPTLTGDTDNTEVFSSASIKLSGGTVQWPAQTASIATVEINAPALNASMDQQGRLSLLDLLPEAADSSAQDSSSPWVVKLDRFSINNGSANFEDAGMSPAIVHSVEQLQLAVTDIDNQEGTSMPVDLSVNLAAGGAVTFNGQAMLLPTMDIAGELGLAGVELPPLQPYLERFANVQLQAGVLAVRADLASNTQQPLSLAGSTEITGLEMADGLQSERLVAWQSLSLDRFELDLAKLEVQTSDIELNGLYGRLHIAEDRSTNIADLLLEQPETTGEPAPGPAITIGGIRLQDTSLDFSDYSLPLPFEAAIRSMNGEISTLSTTSEVPATVALEGQVNEFGLARINGQLNAWDVTDLADVRVEFENLDMSRLTPYTIQFAGYAIEEGRLDLDLNYQLNQRQVAGQNKVIVRDITLGEKVDHPDAGSLPLGLAVALLTDSEGVIDLELPVSGNLDDPEFEIGGVVWQAIGNLVAKVVTAPFRLLGNLVGIDSEDFGTLSFQPGRADISPPDKEKLLKLAEAMLQRPGLTLEVGGVYDAGQDGVALQTQAADTLIEAREAALENDEDVLSTERRRTVLEALALENNPTLDLALVKANHTTVQAEGEEAAESSVDLPAYDADLYDRLVQAQAIGETELLALGNARAMAIIETLDSSQADSTLRVNEAETTAAEESDEDGIHLELSVSVEDAAAKPEDPQT